MIRKHLHVISFLIISGILSYIFSYRLHGGQFLFSGDQMFRFSLTETVNYSFFIRSMDNLGVSNGYRLINDFWNIVYFLLTYSLHIPFQWVEKILFFTIIFLTLQLSYIGIRKIFQITNTPLKNSVIYIITLWYVFNPYTISLWHGGVFDLSLALFYGITPLIYYYVHITLFKKLNIKNICILALLLCIASFTFWLFAALLFFFVIYVYIYLLLNRQQVLQFLKNSFILLIIYLPLVSFIIFNILYEFSHNGGDNNGTFSPSFGNELGGLWYQLLMLFSWGIYNIWYPRTMYSFHAFYFSPLYIIATLGIYLIISGGLLNEYFLSIKKYISVYVKRSHFSKLKLSAKDKIVLCFLTCFYLSLFFAKAAQPPFGEIFLFFYNHIPFFSVFRTADIRFGFPIIFSLTVLLIIVSKQFNKYVFCMILGLIISIQSFLFFNGTVMYGENVVGKFYDRISYIPIGYTQLVDFFQSQKQSSSFILPFPAIQDGEYILDTKKHLFGQDILQKLIYRPFMYLSETSGTATKTYESLQDVFQKHEYKNIANFPIGYLVIRRDVVCLGCSLPQKNDLEKYYPLVFYNALFDVYAIKNHLPLVTSKDITFQVINPTQVQVQFHNIKTKQSLLFLLSYNKDWILQLTKITQPIGCTMPIYYLQNTIKECDDGNRYDWKDILSNLFDTSVFDTTHRLFDSYANQWTIDPKYIKATFPKSYYTQHPDGSIDFEITIYYKAQTWFYITSFVSFVSFIIISIYIIRSVKKQRKKYEKS